MLCQGLIISFVIDFITQLLKCVIRIFISESLFKTEFID